MTNENPLHPDQLHKHGFVVEGHHTRSRVFFLIPGKRPQTIPVDSILITHEDGAQSTMYRPSGSARRVVQENPDGNAISQIQDE